MYEWYITPEDYATAEKNGISKGTLEQRIRDLAWGKKRAITTPPRQQKSLKEWADIAEANGIKWATLQKRMHILKWEPERAATEPLVNRHEHMASVARGRRKYPKEYQEKAKENGISERLFRQRCYNGWTLEDASTIAPVNPRDRRMFYKNKYGLTTRKLREGFYANHL